MMRAKNQSRDPVRALVALTAAGLLFAVVSGAISVPATKTDTSIGPWVLSEPDQREWNPLLAEARAGPVSATADCFPESETGHRVIRSPERPQASWNGSLAAAFDLHTGSILYFDANRETWSFDVCTNSWSLLEPSGSPPEHPSGGLVYDVDSAVTIALGEEIVVYEAETNTWRTPVQMGIGSPGVPFGGVYDPLSGLVVTTIYPHGVAHPDSRVEIWAYDVETTAWTRLGSLGTQSESDPWQYDLVGYAAEIDRLILTPTASTPQDHTMLLDPRTGMRTRVWTETPAVNLNWPHSQYAVGQGTVFVAGSDFASHTPDDRSDDLICGFDLAARTWSSCLRGPGRPGFGAFTWFGAIVDDTINNRLVLVNGLFGDFGTMSNDTVWALYPATGEVIELLSPQR